MKKIILLFLFSASVFSQNYKVVYGKSSFSTEKDLNEIKDINVKNNIISINNSFNQLEYELLINDEFAVFQYVKKLKLPDFNPRAITAGGGEGIHYYNKANQTEVFATEMSGKKYYIESPINKYEWKITNESKIINDFLCYRAEANVYYDDFRGKETYKIEAWFCPALPFSFGPDVYYGLPGLVFEAYKTNSKVKFYLKSIEKFDTEISISFPKESTVTEQEFTAIFNAGMKKLTEEN